MRVFIPRELVDRAAVFASRVADVLFLLTHGAVAIAAQAWARAFSGSSTARPSPGLMATGARQ
eukprot:8322287-Pyramimonas_sp.AAC.1